MAGKYPLANWSETSLAFSDVCTLGVGCVAELKSLGFDFRLTGAQWGRSLRKPNEFSPRCTAICAFRKGAKLATWISEPTYQPNVPAYNREFGESVSDAMGFDWNPSRQTVGDRPVFPGSEAILRKTRSIAIALAAIRKIPVRSWVNYTRQKCGQNFPPANAGR